jgi:hypothetical protein
VTSLDGHGFGVGAEDAGRRLNRVVGGGQMKRIILEETNAEHDADRSATR